VVFMCAFFLEGGGEQEPNEGEEKEEREGRHDEEEEEEEEETRDSALFAPQEPVVTEPQTDTKSTMDYFNSIPRS